MSDLKRNLVESADAAARVGVLFVAVGIFAAMWESDSPPAKDDGNWLARRARSTQVVVGAAEDSTRVHRLQSSRTGYSDVLHGVSMQTVNIQQYPMPAGIVPGDYRVVDSLGQVQTLHVPSETASIIDSRNPLDQYILEDGDRTIYFIRIRGEVNIGDSVIAGAHANSARQ